VIFLEAVKSRGKRVKRMISPDFFGGLSNEKLIIWTRWLEYGPYGHQPYGDPFPQVERILEDDGCPQRALSEQNSLHWQQQSPDM
jgi:hypothetical protein